MLPASPPPSAIDDERLREIVRIVRAALDSPKQAEARPSPIARCGMFLVANWTFTAFLASVMLLALAWLLYDTSPLYWAKQIRSADLELDRKDAKLAFDREVADRYRMQGEKLLDVWQMADAEKAFQKALELDPASTQAALGLTKAQMFALPSSGRYDAEVVGQRIGIIEEVASKSCKQRASEASGDHDSECHDAHALAARGDLNYFLGAWPEAQADYREALALRPTLAHAHFGLGMTELKQQRWPEAAAEFGRAADLSPYNWKYQTNRVFALVSTGDWAAAKAEYQRLWRLAPDLALPYVEAAAVYRKTAGNGDLNYILQITQHVDVLLAGREIDSRNLETWLLRTDNSEIAPLAGLEEKRAYLGLSIGATLFLLGDEQGGVARARQVPVLQRDMAVTVSRLVEHDCAEIEIARPDLAPRVARLREIFRQEKLLSALAGQ